jgi:mannose-6-phosphate isomerase
MTATEAEQRFGAVLLFEPVYQTRVWGGRRLEEVLGRTLPDEQPYGESWELVDRPQVVSVVAEGPARGMSLAELWAGWRVQVWGAEALSWGRCAFPLLIKVLDCTDDLSLQVHPPESAAKDLGGEPKTEMWYVAAAAAGARLWAGLRPGVTREQFERGIAEGKVAELVHAVEAQAGDSLHVPSGRLHALGGGLLIYEVQQNSDTTYRVFDWNRLGLDGKPRDLHVAESLQCIDFDDRTPALQPSSVGAVLSSCPHFSVRRMSAGQPQMLLALSEVLWDGVRVSPGRVAIRPAALPPATPVGEWLEIQLPVQTADHGARI